MHFQNLFQKRLLKKELRMELGLELEMEPEMKLRTETEGTIDENREQLSWEDSWDLFGLRVKLPPFTTTLTTQQLR